MTTNKQLNVGVVGLSHLGIVWSIGNADLGFNVLGYDPDAATVNRLNRDDLIIPEPGLVEQYQRAKSNLHFSVSSEGLAECSVIFFAKDVPYDEEGVIDLTEVDTLWDYIIPHIASDTTVVFMGQVPAGYTRKKFKEICKKRPDLKFDLIYRLQTLTIGQSVSDFSKPDRIVLGLESKHQPLPENFVKVVLEPFDCPHTRANYESAELTKAAISIYLANAVTFVNFIGDLAENVGADIRDIVAAMKLDKRFSPLCYWRPGLGFSGGHLERDLMSLSKLSQEHNIVPRMLQTIIQNSKERYQWLVNVLDSHVFIKRDTKPKICLWGLAYKKGTDSLHNAHCLKVFRDYSDKADFVVYDPVAQLPDNLKSKGIAVASDRFSALQGVDVLVVLTEWEEFKVNDATPFKEMRNALVIDCVDVIGRRVETEPTVKLISMGVGRVTS